MRQKFENKADNDSRAEEKENKLINELKIWE